MACLKIGKEARHPRCGVPLENVSVHSGSTIGPRRQPRHDLAQDRDMVLGLGLRPGPLDADALQICAQTSERSFVEKAGEVIGCLGQQLAAADADEEIEELPLDLLSIGARRRCPKLCVRKAERRRIAW